MDILGDDLPWRKILAYMLEIRTRSQPLRVFRNFISKRWPLGGNQGAILGLNLVLVDGGQLLQNVCFGLGFACFLIMNYWMQNQFSSVAQLCPTPCDPMDCSTPGLPVHHQLPELAQTHIHRGGDAIQPSHPLSSLSPPAFNLFQHPWLFQWISSSHQVAKVLELQLQHQFFPWIYRVDFL